MRHAMDGYSTRQGRRVKPVRRRLSALACPIARFIGCFDFMPVCNAKTARKWKTATFAQGGVKDRLFRPRLFEAPFVAMFMKTIHAPLLFLLATAALTAAPARHPSYEPPALATTVRDGNLFLNADTSASGHWRDRSPDLAVNGKADSGDHWACENLPAWHQVNLKEPATLASLCVRPYWGDGRIYQYKVEGSLDGNAWVVLADMTANSIAASAEGSFFSFPAVQVRHVRTTFLKNSRGADAGGHLVEIEGFGDSPETGLSGGIGSVDFRYPPSGNPPDLIPAEKGIHLTAWRGETVNAQIVLTSSAKQEALRLDPLVLTGDGRVDGTCRFVRHTLADGKPQGDILDTATGLDLPAGTTRAVWIQFEVPAGAKPGTCSGTLTARTNSSKLEFPIRLDVLTATLPAPESWRFHLDIWQHPQAVARWHDVPLWSDAHFALLKPEMTRLARAGQKTITCSLIHEPWGAQTYDWFPSMIEWTKRADGTWSYDYTVFDRWVSFCSDQCGMANARIHGYSMLPWSMTFRYYDEARQGWVDAKLEPGTPEYDAHWGSFLTDFKSHLKQKGWLERMRIGMDERPDALMKAGLATLAKYAPEILCASAINEPSALTRELDDISPVINHTNSIPRSLLDERRAKGRKTTFYVCCGPATPNTFSFSPPAESEWLPLFAAANSYDGFLRWAYQSYVENPLVSTDFTTWPSGDCFMVYPGGRSSVRWERLRDGIESFEKIHLLRDAADQQATPQARAAIRAIDESLENFTWQRGAVTGPHAADVRLANDAILSATRVLFPINR
jgi:Domain of unknown function (DUF4091)/F5/8 type C domain